MRVISKNSEGLERTFENVKSAVVVTNTGERLIFSASKNDLAYINEDNIQIFTLTLKKSKE